jgi:ribonuclease-3
MIKFPKIRSEKLRLCALTHRSYVNENPDIFEDNERLEFLGDAILGFLVGELLFRRYPQLSEAQLTRLRSNLVDQSQLANLAGELGLGEQIRLGKGAIKDGGRQNPALLSDTLEALVGAYYLDAGLEAVREFVQALFQPIADRLIEPPINSQTPPTHLVDVKNRLQQWSLAQFGQNPEYFLIDESGPDHAKEYILGVRIQNKVYGVGQGRRKQDATKAAALEALRKIGLDG